MRLLRAPDARLGRLPVQLDLRAVNLAEGVRAGLSVALIVAAAQFLVRPALMESALGALFTCLCDAGGPIRRRIPGLLGFAALGTAMTFGFSVLRHVSPAAALACAAIGIFCTSFARIWGQSALQVGNLLTVVLVIAIARPADAPTAGLLAGMFAAGCVWAQLLTLVIWRTYPFAPARRKVGECYRLLALLAADLRGLVGRAPSAAEWEAHARAHRRAVRDAIEQARGAVLDTVRARRPLGGAAAQSLIRLEAADQIFGATIALSELVEANRDPGQRAAAGRMLRVLGPLLTILGRSIAADGVLATERLTRSIAAMEADAARFPDLRAIADAVAERLRILATLAAADPKLPGGGPASGEPELRDRLRAALRANLTWESAALRHALRAAVLGVPAIAFTFVWYHGYEHWLTITLVLTMQPFFALAWQRAVERVAGTVLGGMAAALLAMVCTTPLSIAVALFPLTVLTFAVRAVSFGAFITCITPLVVLLSELGRPGTSELAIAAIRALYTVIGGLIAVAGCLLLWPSWEPQRLRREIGAAMAAHARYAAAELSALLGEAAAETVEAARRGAGVASNALETSLSRALLEPTLVSQKARRDRIEAAVVVDAALRRLAGRLSALQHAADPLGAMPPEAWRAWRDWATGALDGLAAGQPAPPRPAGGAPEPLARIARQIELMDGALRRFPD